MYMAQGSVAESSLSRHAGVAHILLGLVSGGENLPGQFRRVDECIVFVDSERQIYEYDKEECP